MLKRDVDQLRLKVQSWQAELENATTRGTVVMGTVTKGLLGFEGILTDAVRVLTNLLDEEGRVVYKMILGGKVLSTASLGDKRQLLVGLKDYFKKGLLSNRVDCSGNILEQTELDTISRLATLRNRFVHGNLGFNTDLPVSQAEGVAADILSFCKSPFVAAALAADQPRASAHRN